MICRQCHISLLQITRVVTLLDNHLIQEEIKQLSKDLSLVLHEGERDDTSLSLDLWKKPVAYQAVTSFTCAAIVYLSLGHERTDRIC